MTSNFLESTSRGGVDHFMPISAQLLGAGSSQIGFMAGLFSLVSIYQLLWINLSLRIRRSKLFVILGWVVTFCLFIPISVLRKGYFLFL